MAARIEGSERRRDGRANGLVYHQTVGRHLDEGKALQGVEPRIVEYVRNHRGKDRLRGAPHETRGFENRAKRVLHLAQEQRRETFDQVLALEIRPGEVQSFLERARRELERERVTSSKAGEPRARRRWSPPELEELESRRVVERPETQDLDEPRPSGRALPGVDGRVPGEQEEADAGRQRRQQVLSEPPVEQSELL